MVTTKPISNANQSRSITIRGARKSMATLTEILTKSHTKKPKLAVTAFVDENRLISPRANSAAGITTTNPPYAADQPALTRPLHPHANSATAAAATSCPATTHQGDSDGLRARKAWACSALRGADSGAASSSASQSCAGLIIDMSNYGQVTRGKCHKAFDYT